MSEKIAVVVPTIRPESWIAFLEAWRPLFKKHSVQLFKVDDSPEYPVCTVIEFELSESEYQFQYDSYTWLFNKTDGCRNLGFYYAAHNCCDIIITLDDDVFPVGDPIQDHLDALNMSVLPNWVSTAQDWRVRGIPTTGRKWPVMLSHGVWDGVPDFDAPTQFLNPDVQNIAFNKMNIPKGVYFPMCIMNVAFRRELLPWMYQAPMGKRLAEFNLPVGDRFADIWSGIIAKMVCDQKEFGVVTGYSTVRHSRASNVFANMRKEAIFLEQNETFINDFKAQSTNYAKLYQRMLGEWQSELP